MKTGIFEISEDDYHADKIGDEVTVSSSVLNTLLEKSPLHAREQHPRLAKHYRPPEDAKHFDIGTAVHKLVLEGEDAFAMLDFPDWRTKASKEARDVARADGKIPLLTKDVTAVMAMFNAAQTGLPRLDREVSFIEQTLLWKEGDIWCRARPDVFCGTLLTDLKTAVSAHPDQFNRAIWSNGYAIQAAFYRRGAAAITGEQHDWRWWIIEKTPPYAVSVVTLTPAAWDFANRQVEHALMIWAQCLKTGSWAGYPKQVVEVEAPPFVQARFEDQTARGQGS